MIRYALDVNLLIMWEFSTYRTKDNIDKMKLSQGGANKGRSM